MNHLITENDCNATDMEDLAGAFKKPFEMFQFVYSLRALFEGNVLLAYQASSKLWSPAGAPWVSLGCSWGTPELLLGHSRGMCAPSAPRCWHLAGFHQGSSTGQQDTARGGSSWTDVGPWAFSHCCCSAQPKAGCCTPSSVPWRMFCPLFQTGYQRNSEGKRANSRIFMMWSKLKPELKKRLNQSPRSKTEIWF